jgi:alpha/beta superfamily hydrolase
LIGPEPHFIAGHGGQLFALHFPSEKPSGRALLVLPPFAEELNKTRRMLSLAARALQNAGHEVLLVDLYGTGDSAGDFADASFRGWSADLQAASCCRIWRCPPR